MSEQDDPVIENSRVGFRDIYRAVGESEVRITAAINAAIAPVNRVMADHEVRLRSIEIGGSHAAILAREEAAAALVKATAVETVLGLKNAKSAGVLSVFTAGQKTVIIVTSILGAAGVAIEIITRLSA